MNLTIGENVKKDLDEYLGKSCVFKYLLNGSHEIEIIMASNWDLKSFPTALKESFIEPPISVHIISIEFQTLN